MMSSWLIPRVNVWLAVCTGVLESVTVTVTWKEPDKVVVPEMIPEIELMLSPVGKPVADHVYAVVPPVAVTWTA